MKALAGGLCLVLVAGWGTTLHAQQPVQLFRPSTVPAPLTGRPEIVRQRRVELTSAALIDDLSRLRVLQLDLFPDVSLRAVRSRTEPMTVGTAWMGAIEGYLDSDAVLVASGGTLAGRIYLPYGLFTISGSSSGGYLVQQIDAGRGDTAINDVVTDEGADSASTPRDAWGTRADNGSIVDIMIVYTRQALAGFGTEGTARANIGLAVAEVNEAFRSSGVDTQLRLVHSAVVDYAESGDSSLDLSRLLGAADGFMDDVHALRDEYAADLVLLVLEQVTDACGRAVRNGVSSTAGGGFALVRRSCMLAGGAAHEIGHNLGAHHDWYETADPGAFRSSKGFVSLAGRFRDIMSYNTLCRETQTTCVPVLQYSNPRLLRDGRPMGVPEGTNTQCAARVIAEIDCDADAAATLTRIAPGVARFRHSLLALTARRMLPGGAIRSDNGRFRLAYQTDGNLVLYDDWTREVRWTAAIGGDPGEAIVEQSGNFVVYDARRTIVWQTGTSGNRDAYLHVEDDGNVALFRVNGEPLWSTALPPAGGAAPPPAPPVRTSPFEGSWRNADRTSGSLTRATMQVSGDLLIVRLWASCSPLECEWGAKAVPLSETAAGAFSLQWVTTFSVYTQRITLEQSGAMKIAMKTHFTDTSGRPDQETTLSFVKTTNTAARRDESVRGILAR